MVDAIGSYTEVSPSGTGVHILAYADQRTTGFVGRADHRRGIEVCNHGRYFTVTGKQVGDSGIADRTDEVASLVSERFPSESRESSFSRRVARLARDKVVRRANWCSARTRTRWRRTPRPSRPGASRRARPARAGPGASRTTPATERTPQGESSPASCSAPESRKSTSNADWSGQWPQ